MDQKKTGKFIAQLRRERGMTQETLGERIGVTGKTVSRWETGVYMPDIGTLSALAEEFSVSVDEIIAGKRHLSEILTDSEENKAKVPTESSFSLHERIAYFKRKWLRDHIFEIIAEAVIAVILFSVGIAIEREWLSAAGIISAFALYFRGRNDMMAYVETRAFIEKK